MRAGSSSSSCSSVRAPSTGAVTPSVPSSQASATCGIVAPCAAAISAAASTTRKFAFHGAPFVGLLVVPLRFLDAAPLRRRLAPPVAAREEAGAERSPGQNAEPGRAAEREQLELDRPLDQ